MPLFGPPNVKKMKAKGNIKGLIKALDFNNDRVVRRAAAEALVAIYKSGRLGAKEVNAILAREKEIIPLCRHTDRPEVCAFPHEDFGTKDFHADFSL
jgi:hypothetical protein